jgi:hypothetical protein
LEREHEVAAGARDADLSIAASSLFCTCTIPTYDVVEDCSQKVSQRFNIHQFN